MTYKLQAANVLSLEERKKTIEIYNTRLIDLGIKKNDIIMSWDGNTINVIISNPGRYGEIKEQITDVLTAEGNLSFWETYAKDETYPFLDKAFGTKKQLKQFTDLFDPESFPPRSFDSLVFVDKSCLVGYVYEKNMSRVNEILDSLQNLKKFPENLKFAWSAKPNKDHPDAYELISLKSSKDGKAILDKPLLTEVSAIINKYNSVTEISMRMDSATAIKWAGITKVNIGKILAIVLDGTVFSYPFVNSEITGGVSNISGVFDKTEADHIVSLLKTVPLPSPMKMIGENDGK